MRWVTGLFLFYCASAWPQVIPASSPVAFVGVNVVPMDEERVLARQTVVVRGGRIADIGPVEQIVIPPDAVRIPSSGYYLMPALADMHIHEVNNNPNWANDLFLYVANGVTTVREMWGTANYLGRRQAIDSGATLGPRMIVASPGMDGPGGSFSSVQSPIATPAQARQAVADYQAAGYDFIKVYTDLTPDVYAAICDEARRRGIKVVGHIPRRVGLTAVLQAGQYSIEHIVAGGFDAATSTGSLTTGVVNEAQVQAIAAAIREAGAWLTPTLLAGAISYNQVPALEARREMRYVSPQLTAWLRSPLCCCASGDRSRYLANAQQILKTLHDGGVKLLLGVDSSYRYLLPGFSIHDELRLIVEAGLTPYQAIRMGTVNAAAFMDRLQDRGTVEIGKRADLLLVAGNPLEDVAYLRRRFGVMAEGQWLPDPWLRGRLEETALSYGYPPLDPVCPGEQCPERQPRTPPRFVR